MREQEVLRLRKRDLTQKEVAAELDITQAAVSSFENNAKRKIADAMQTVALAKELGYSDK